MDSEVVVEVKDCPSVAFFDFGMNLELPSPLQADDAESHSPVLDKLDFPEELLNNEPVSFDDLITFSPSLAPPPSPSSESLPKDPKMTFLLNPLALPSSFTDMMCFITDSVATTPTSFLTPMGKFHLNEERSPRPEFSSQTLDSVGCTFQLVSPLPTEAIDDHRGDSTTVTAENLSDNLGQFDVCDHNYSLLPIGDDGAETAMPSTSRSISMSSIDFKFLEEILVGGRSRLSSKRDHDDDDDVVSESNDLDAKKMILSKVRAKSRAAEGAGTPRLSEDEMVEGDAAATDETRRKYLERRKKNNIASRRSRQIRKMKYSDMEKKAIELADENKELKLKIAKLEACTAQMKEALIQKLKGL